MWKRWSKCVWNHWNEGIFLWKWFEHGTRFITILSDDKTTWIPLWFWFLNDEMVTHSHHFERNICIFCWTKMFQISWKNWFSWVWKHKIEFIFRKISFEDVTMKRRLFLREINFLKDGKRILKVKLGEFYHHFGDIFQKSNLWITFENVNFLIFFFKKKEFLT